MEYEENDDDPKNPDIPETESNDYNTGYDEDMDLEIEEEHNYKIINQREI